MPGDIVIERDNVTFYLPLVTCLLLSRAAQLDQPGIERDRMVDRQIVARGVRDPRVLAAMREVPRQPFVERGRLPVVRETRAVTPLPTTPWAGVPETYPFGL